MGWEGMHLTAMVDLQYVSFRVEGEPRAEIAKGRGGDEVCVLEKEGRGRDSMEGRQVGNAVARLQPLGGDDTSRGGRWLNWAK
jgi:hypothetical protein